MATSIYGPLNREQQETRLLSVLPASNDSDSQLIKCGLQKVRLEDLGKGHNYVALSYTWVDPNIRLPITVNGKTIQVTTKLESALRHLRVKFSLSTFFWIDSVCINQRDDEEKTQQVSQMRDIFAKAELVIMWVGEAGEVTNFHFATIERWADDGVRMPAEDTQDEGDNEADEGDYLLQVAGLPDIMEAFLRRPYFTRSWIVQEVVVSKYTMLVCGSFWIHFDRFVKACYAMGVHSLYKRLRGVILDITNMRLWQRMLRANPEHSSKLDLMLLLTSERDKQASDPRDKVFALLGIADQTGGTPLAVDYSKSVEECYTAVAKHLLIASEHLKVLSAVQGQWTKLSMPSWVPDWSQRWYGGGAINVRWKETPFRAAGNTKAILVPCPDQSAVCFRGFRLDVVRQSGGVRLCNRRTEDESPFVNEDSLRADIKTLGLQDKNHYDLTKEPYVDAYLRTITCDLSACSSRLDDQSHASDRPSFYAWTQASE